MLHEGGVITGKVTYVNKTGIANSSIRASGSDWRYGPKDAYTDETGGYILTGLGGGNYIVYADSPYGTNLAGNSTDVIVRLDLSIGYFSNYVQSLTHIMHKIS